MASSENNNWQANFKTNKERNKFLLNNNIMSDVTFIFGEDKNQNVKGRELFGHKLILSTSSSVFYDTFFNNKDETPETDKEKNDISINSNKIFYVTIKDINKDTFLEFLKYIYIEECHFTGSNVTDILYLSKKYMMAFLEEDCYKFVTEYLEADAFNVIEILQRALFFEFEDLKNKCIQYIKPYISYILKSDQIIQTNKQTLEAIFSLNEIGPCEEFEFFTVAIKWSAAECKRKGITVNGANKRLTLGDIIKFIRFPVMTYEQFGKCLEEEGFFTDKEISAVVIYISTKQKKNLSFGTEKRKSILDKIPTIEVNLFDGTKTQFTCYKDVDENCKFTVNKCLYILSISVGKVLENQFNSDIKIQFLNDNNECLAEIFHEKFDKKFNFPEPILIKPNLIYSFNFKFKNQLTFEGSQKRNLPYKVEPMLNDIGLVFSPLSQILTGIEMKYINN